MSTTNESIWSDIRRRGNGTDVKKEDDVNLLDIDGLYDYIKSKYEKRLFYLDKDVYGPLNKKNIVADVLSNVSLFTTYDKKGNLEYILLSWSKVKIGMPFFDKLSERFNVQSPNVCRRRITEKDGTCTNQTYIDVIDFFLENIDNMLVNESIWNDIRKRGNGSEIKKEDEIPQELQKPLAIYIEMFASNAFKGDYTVGSYPDFRAFVKDFMNSPRIESLDFDMGDLLDYITQDHYYDVIHPVIMDTIQKINKEIDVAVDNIIDSLKDSNVNESVWNDIRKRGNGDSVKEEEFTEEFIDKVKSDLIGFTMSVVYYIENYELTFDGFYKYLEEIENPDEVKKIIYYVKTHKDECDKLLEKDIKFENKLLDEKVNVYLLRFIDNIVYDEKYHNTLSDIKKFASEIFKGHKSSYDFHINKKLVFKDKSELFNDYIEDKWKDGSLKQKIDDLIKNENDEISKYGFVKEPGKTIADTVNDWWDSLDKDKRNDLGWDEFGEDAEEEYYSDHNPKYNEYSGEDFDADEWWDDAYGIRRVKIYCSEHSKTNESVWNDIRRRGNGTDVKKEDEMTPDDLDALNDFIFGFATRVVWDGIRDSLTNFLKYIDENPEALDCDIDRVKKYVEDNWHKSICDDVEAAIEQEDKEKKEGMNESIWNDIRRRGNGTDVKKEDEMTPDDFLMLRGTAKMFLVGVRNYSNPKNHKYAPRRIDGEEGFIDYILERKKEHFWNAPDEVYDKLIKFVKDNWGDCTGIQDFMDKYLSNINECDGVPDGITPADIGGMGPAYFPGLNGEPGSGDLPSPTGIVYKQVAPFDTFIKMRRPKKNKKKKFRKEDEPCVHSKNPPIYSYVDDFRDYVDRTYNNIDKRK